MPTLTDHAHTVQSWYEAGKRAALAVLVRSSGATPLPLGETMVVSSAMDMQGAVSRGCVESAVLEAATSVIAEDHALLCHFGYSDESAWQVGLTCGGEIDVLVSPLPPTSSGNRFLRTLLDLSQRSQPFFLLYILDENLLGKKLVCDQAALLYSDLPSDLQFTPSWLETVPPLSSPAIRPLTLASGATLSAFIQPILPPPRLFIVGAAEIAIHLTRLAKLLGFSVIIIDPRSMFATPTRFPQADVILSTWPQDCPQLHALTARDALAVISHDHKIDIPALQLGLESDVAYLGLLGSMKTRQERFDTLLASGWRPTDLDRIHAPIGLNLHTKKADEIALAILAQIVQEKNQV
ncbi:MAG: XdhC family protein [Chloroflexi bacterium]|nr:XdhC family protein [Chloroflexota bacterium]